MRYTPDKVVAEAHLVGSWHTEWSYIRKGHRHRCILARHQGHDGVVHALAHPDAAGVLRVQVLEESLDICRDDLRLALQDIEAHRVVGVGDVEYDNIIKSIFGTRSRASWKRSPFDSIRMTPCPASMS